jgi:hypothetical protein
MMPNTISVAGGGKISATRERVSQALGAGREAEV